MLVVGSSYQKKIEPLITLLLLKRILCLSFDWNFINIIIITVLPTDSSDIVDCKLKLILGLIWTLILHYSISMPVWEGEEQDYHQGEKGPTPKQR